MLNKKDFCHFIKFIKDRQDNTYRLNKVFQKEFEDSCIYPYNKYETEMIKLLELSMNADKCNDWIQYYIYELDFGDSWEPGYIVDENGEDIKLQTPEDLYNLLVEDAKGEEE